MSFQEAWYKAPAFLRLRQARDPPRLRIRHRLARRDAALDSGKPKAQAALKLFQRRLASRH